MNGRFDRKGTGARPRRRRAGADTADVPSLVTGDLRVPEGFPPSLWRRLRIFGSWAAVAGRPLDAVSRPVHFDERRRIVRIAVASPRWSAEIAAYEDILRKRLETMSGQRIDRLELTVTPGSFGPAPVVRSHSRDDETEEHRKEESGTDLAAGPMPSAEAGAASDPAREVSTSARPGPFPSCAAEGGVSASGGGEAGPAAGGEAPSDISSRLERLRDLYLAAAAARRR